MQNCITFIIIREIESYLLTMCSGFFFFFYKDVGNDRGGGGGGGGTHVECVLLMTLTHPFTCVAYGFTRSKKLETNKVCSEDFVSVFVVCLCDCLFVVFCSFIRSFVRFLSVACLLLIFALISSTVRDILILRLGPTPTLTAHPNTPPPPLPSPPLLPLTFPYFASSKTARLIMI